MLLQYGHGFATSQRIPRASTPGSRPRRSSRCPSDRSAGERARALDVAGRLWPARRDEEATRGASAAIRRSWP